MAFSYYKSLTLNHTQAGSADSTNWPLTIALDGNVQAADADLKTVGNGGYVQNSNGYDIRPYSDSALTSALTYELVYYDGTTGKLEMHVKIPTLSHTSDTVIYLAFGDASISTDGSSSGTWNSNYKAVYHFKDGTTLNLTDSTSNANNGTNNSATATTGEIDGGIAFSGSSQYVNIGNGASLQGLTGDITIEGWIKPTDFANYNGIVGKTGQTPSSPTTGPFPFPFDSYIEQTTGKLVLLQGAGDINSYDAWTANSAVSSGSWSHFLMNISNSGTGSRAANLYVNGSSVGMTSTWSKTFTPTDGGQNAYIATRSDLATMFKGSVDELRISNNLRGADWELASYNSQKASSTFITWGALTPINTSPFWQFTWKYWQ